MDKKAQKREVKNKVKEKLIQGNSKQDTFDSLADSFPGYRDYQIADIIRNQPTTMCLERLKKTMALMVLMMVISLAYKFFFAVNIYMKGSGINHYYFVFPVLFSVLLIGVILKDGRSIRNVSFLGYFNIVAGVPLVMNNFVFIMVGDILLTIVLIVYSIYLSSRMFPKYEYTTKFGVNEKGQKRGVKVIRFIERK